MNARRLARMFSVAALAGAVAVGCADQQTDELGDDEFDLDPAPGAEQMDTADIGEPMGMDAETIELDAVNESEVDGDATITPMGDSLRVVLTLSGLDAEAEYPAHIHRGNCDDGGPVAEPLEAVTTATGDSGMSESTIARSALPTDEGAFLQAHGQDGEPIACADIDDLDRWRTNGTGTMDGGMDDTNNDVM